MLKHRQKFLDYIRRTLTGSLGRLTSTQNIASSSKDLILQRQPLEQFQAGFLFPFYADEEVETDDNSVLLKKTKYQPPNSAGLSFYVKGNMPEIEIEFCATHYTHIQNGRKSNWARKELAPETVTINNAIKIDQKVLNDKARLSVIWRQTPNGLIGTVTIINDQTLTVEGNPIERAKERNQNTLFEVELKCTFLSGEVGNFPKANFSFLEPEQQEIEFRYRHKESLAIGHGVATNWGKNPLGLQQLWIDFMPQAEIPQMTANTGGSNVNVLKFNYLQNLEENQEIFSDLEDFIESYSIWIAEQEVLSEEQTEDFRETSRRVSQKQKVALQRMTKSLQLLKQDRKVQKAFSFANKAMLMQWKSSDNNKGKSIDDNEYAWRPFQLGFIILAMESTINENSNDRDICELIWFPTGGGKTEAYLGLMAILILFRRLNYRSSYKGTTCLMRYTLRLLSSQQFLRANKVIFALELIRQAETRLWGDEPISIGFWVGRDTAPNSLSEATKKIENNKYSDFVLNSCPWCATTFNQHNYVINNETFYFQCHNQQCDFGKNKQPLVTQVIDECLYQSPPTLLVSTVDKFARLTWEERAQSFFGVNSRPPELIIQDELHLITSALGSIVGLYEVGIDTAIKAKNVSAKYIASSATIRNAEEQIQKLFARRTNVFPPPGMDDSDSYFAKVVPLNKKPGRTYIGFLSPLLSRNESLAPLSAALLSAPSHLFGTEIEYLDSWWTQIIYHTSLKSLGNTRTLFQNTVPQIHKENQLKDIKEYVSNLFPEKFSLIENKTYSELEANPILADLNDPDIQQAIKLHLKRSDSKIDTLNSNQSVEQNQKVFNDLTKQQDQTGCIDVALATNMISVGLDVSRLALMILNGQPLTTAEYIQASSRVGRSSTPGLVFVNYLKSQTRSLSYYEDFKAFHQSYYKYVEPSSITPFTFQARKKALHASIILALRHSGIGLNHNQSSSELDISSPHVQKVLNTFKARAANAIGKQIDSSDFFEIERHITRIMEDWKVTIEDAEETIVYNSQDRGVFSLLTSFEKPNEGKWPTLNSMRNVESTAIINQHYWLEDYV